MPDPTGPTPEAYEAADQARRRHVFATTSTCFCGFMPTTGKDWDAHLVRVAVDASWPLAFAAGVAEGRRQEHVESVEYDKGYLAGFTEGRAIAAADIRARAADVITRAEVLAEVPQGSGGDHPAAMAMELAARIAEGATDV